jgi:hypothetical protein
MSRRFMHRKKFRNRRRQGNDRKSPHWQFGDIRFAATISKRLDAI